MCGYHAYLKLAILLVIFIVMIVGNNKIRHFNNGSDYRLNILKIFLFFANFFCLV